MSKIILSLIFTFCVINNTTAKAKIPVCLPCETIQTIQELPTDSEIQKIVGQKVNLSYFNNEYGAIWIPVWNADSKYVLSDISNNTYIEIDDQLAKILKEKHNFDIQTAESPLSFWNKIGGKLVLLVIISLLIWAYIPSKNKTKEIKPTNI